MYTLDIMSIGDGNNMSYQCVFGYWKADDLPSISRTQSGWAFIPDYKNHESRMDDKADRPKADHILFCKLVKCQGKKLVAPEGESSPAACKEKNTNTCPDWWF